LKSKNFQIFDIGTFGSFLSSLSLTPQNMEEICRNTIIRRYQRGNQNP